MCDPTPDSCVEYTGKDFPCLGIESGYSYDVVTVALADKLCDFVDQEIELECLFEEGCELSSVKLPKAVE